MKIIKPGVVTPMTFRMQCDECGCIFEFNNTEAKYDQREDSHWVGCPTCRKALYVNLTNYKKQWQKVGTDSKG